MATPRKVKAVPLMVQERLVPVAETGVFTLSREEARMVHRALFDTGWYLRWGQDENSRVAKRLNEFFAGDDAHLKAK